jgi:hypothetical protein
MVLDTMQQDQEFKISLGHIERRCFKQNKTKTKKNKLLTEEKTKEGYTILEKIWLIWMI